MGVKDRERKERIQAGLEAPFRQAAEAEEKRRSQQQILTAFLQVTQMMVATFGGRYTRAMIRKVTITRRRPIGLDDDIEWEDNSW